MLDIKSVKKYSKMQNLAGVFCSLTKVAVASNCFKVVFVVAIFISDYRLYGNHRNYMRAA
jgi:hypothetical protein